MKKYFVLIILILSLLICQVGFAQVPAYQNYAPIADKALLPDGSIVSIMSGTVIAGPDATRAAQYNTMPWFAAKYLMPDGTIKGGLPSLPSGTYDCSTFANLQACADAAAIVNYKIYIPTGIYTTGLVLTTTHNNLVVEGAGYSSYIHVASGNAIDIRGTAGAHVTGIKISNLRIKSDDTAYALTQSAIYTLFTDHSVYSNLDFNGSPYQSIYLDNSSYNLIEKSRFLNNTYARATKFEITINDGTVAGGDSWGNKVIGNTIIVPYAGAMVFNHYAYAIEDSNENEPDIVSNNYVSAPGSDGLYSWGGTFNITGNIFYACGAGVYTDGASGSNIIGNSFIGNTKACMSQDTAGVIEGNTFFNNTTNIQSSGNDGFRIGINNELGGARIIYNQTGAITVHGVLSTISSGLVGMRYSSEAGFYGTTARDFFIITAVGGTFGSPAIGDVIYVPYEGVYRIVKVIDSTHLLLDGVPNRQTSQSSYQIFRGATFIDGKGNVNLDQNAMVKGGGKIATENIIPATVTTGSIAAINATPTVGGTGYSVGDLFQINTALPGSFLAGDAIGQVTGVNAGVVTSVSLIDSGSSGYVVGTGTPTTRMTYVNSQGSGSGAGLTVNITAVGLTAAQVSGSIITNAGQGPNSINNYLPSEKAGQSFKLQITETQAANYYRLTAFTASSMCVDGVCGLGYLNQATPVLGTEIACKTILGAGTGVDTLTGLAIGGTTTAVASGAFTFDIAGVGYSKAAVAAGTALSAGTIPQNTWGLYLFSIAANGTITVTPAAGNGTGYGTEALAIATIPATPASSAVMGYVTVMNTAAGGFVAGTTALNAGTVTAHYLPYGAYTKAYYWDCKTQLPLIAANIPATPSNSGSGAGLTLTGPRQYQICSSTCTVTAPIPPAAGTSYAFCVANGTNVGTVITLAMPTGVYVENQARTANSTVGPSHGIASVGAVGDIICIFSVDATHYLTPVASGTWTTY